MSENTSNPPAELPLTAKTFADELRSCGVSGGHTIIAHMAMSKLDWVIGGAQAILMGFLDVLGESGTLMMPTHTLDNCDPAEWQHPPVPQHWWQYIRDHMPAYDPQLTPSKNMGAVPELLRTYPGAIRSTHPMTSFAAIGPNAHYLMDNHPLEHETGDGSPIGRLYELDGYVLLLGVEHWNNTSLHLAEERADYPGKSTIKTGCAMFVDGQRQWVEVELFETYGDDFGQIGDAFDEAHDIQVHTIKNADVRYFKQRQVVDFAVDWIETHRDLTRAS